MSKESSQRNADIGEVYPTSPRINSSHLRVTYSRILQLTNNLDFNSPIFNNMQKRSRSLGSTQAFLCELVFANREFFQESVKPFCVAGGANLLVPRDPIDDVYFNRLLNQKAKVVEDGAMYVLEKTKRVHFPGRR